MAISKRFQAKRKGKVRRGGEEERKAEKRTGTERK